MPQLSLPVAAVADLSAVPLHNNLNLRQKKDIKYYGLFGVPNKFWYSLDMIVLKSSYT